MEKHTNELNVLQVDETKSYIDRGRENNSFPQIPDSSNGSCICRPIEKWTSPSDLIIDLVNLKPPLTSKIARGKTHIGIQSIGETYLVNEKEIFHKSIKKVLKDNDDIWKFILRSEIKTIHKRAKETFKQIFEHKQSILAEEMSKFYEKTLAELEQHVKSEAKTIAYSFQTSLLDQLNSKIEERLKCEGVDLDKELNEELNAELNKIRNYYDILLKNEMYNYTKLKNKAIQERNDAVLSFYRQIESERLTSTMYVLSSERKKCKVKKIMLENIQYEEIINTLNIFVQKDILLDDLVKENEILPILNKKWQDQVVKIFRLFLKFIGFSLNILPEQTSFLLDFEKMVILQLNEFQKQPYNPSQMLIDKEDHDNMFEFNEQQSVQSVCEEAPFQIAGRLESPFSLFLNYGSRETIGGEADYPYFRVQRKYVYAKCHGFEKIKELLGANLCRFASKEVETIFSPLSNFEAKDKKEYLDSRIDSSVTSSKSTSIHMEPDLNKVNTIRECPNNCGKLNRVHDFFDLNSFLEYNDKNYENLISGFGEQQPELIDSTRIKVILFNDIAFPAVEEDFKTVGVQCENDVDHKNSAILCDCTETDNCDNTSKGCKIHDVLLKRELSLKKLLKSNPKLFSTLFSDESYNCKV
ncbi:uncharacterized protein LOC121728937 [Aricia agestis]|uniref:uncharacterized protein LOC121728937 n=1 Tax=Aricia agestis TaxID=91739 RepID=UPI001C202675|nr:uncharacterized protein LOC121728937 [Aricia agestis]